MKIILKQDVENLGHKDEIVNVKPGYGRNYLIPQKIAILATTSAVKQHEEILKQRSHKETKLISDAEKLVEKLQNTKIQINVKTSEKGKIFGSVTNVMLAETLENIGIEIDRKNITLKTEPIKELGVYSANIKIYKNIKANINFEVISEVKE